MIASRESRAVGQMKSRILALLILALTAGCTVAPGIGSGSNGADAPSKLSFRPPVVVSSSQDAHEPSLEIAPDGTIYICSPRGSGRGTDLWRSMDGGATFESLGEAAAAALPPRRSTTGDSGGGDCDIGIDASGRVYLADLWVGSASVAASGDRGQTWTGAPVSQMSGTMDRPWALGGAAGEVFVVGKDIPGTVIERSLEDVLPKSQRPAVGGVIVSRSTDGGMTFPQQVQAVGNEDRFATGSNLAAGKSNLYLYYTKGVREDRVAHVVAISKDRGLTWTQKVVAEQPWMRNTCAPYPTQVFPVIAADPEGGVYITWASVNPTTRRIDLFFAASPDEGEHWSAPLMITDRPGTRYFPWLVAGEKGHVGIAWYESNRTLYPQNVTTAAERATCKWDAEEPVDWFVHYAESWNASSPNPHFEETVAQAAPVHRGSNLDRPFAELLQVAFDPSGRAGIAYVSDTTEAPARPMFVVQAPVEGPLS